MKLVVVSDNHSNVSVLEMIKSKYKDQDVIMVHCGDSEGEYTALKGFVAVRGNNDFGLGYPAYCTFEHEGMNVYVTHGHRDIMYGSKMRLLARAQEHECNLVLYGHTHIFDKDEYEGVTFVNPGSLQHNRDGSRPCYAEIDIKNGKVNVKRIDL